LTNVKHVINMLMTPNKYSNYRHAHHKDHRFIGVGLEDNINFKVQNPNLCYSGHVEYIICF